MENLEQAEQKQNHRYREYFDDCQMGRGLGRCSKKVKGLRNTNWLLRNSHGDIKYSKGNRVAKEHICMTMDMSNSMEMA